MKQFAEGELAFSVYEETVTRFHLWCYAVGTGDYGRSIAQKVVTDVNQGRVGVKTQQVDASASYPCSNQDDWGYLMFQVIDLNGGQIGEAQSITVNGEPQYQFSSDTKFYNDTLNVTQVVNDDLTIQMYMFRNAAAQAAANLQHTMTIGTMDACKMEMLYNFRPKAGGGLNATIVVKTIGFEVNGTYRNPDVSSVTNQAENKLSIYIPKHKLLEGSGLSPDGCVPTFDGTGGTTTTTASPDDDGLHRLLDVSLSLVCASTGELVNPTFEFESTAGASELRLSLSSTQAPESCGVLIWDPLVTPVEVTASNGGSSIDLPDWSTTTAEIELDSSASRSTIALMPLLMLWWG
jgi:hypothetical protein